MLLVFKNKLVFFALHLSHIHTNMVVVSNLGGSRMTSENKASTFQSFGAGWGQQL